MDARKAKSRAAIVTAFSELLREEDYGKITVGDIIARAHVGRATFYGLFKSKDDLLSELVSDICTHALDDVASAVRADPDMAELPVMMLTAKGQGRDREAAERAGADLFMAKPFSNAEFVAAARSLVET